MVHGKFFEGELEYIKSHNIEVRIVHKTGEYKIRWYGDDFDIIDGTVPNRLTKEGLPWGGKYDWFMPEYEILEDESELPTVAARGLNDHDHEESRWQRQDNKRWVCSKCHPKMD